MRGTWLLAASGLVGLIVSLINYFGLHNGIDHTAGALLVVISTALILAATLVLLFAGGLKRWARVLLDILVLLDIIGTGFAGYMLEANLLLALMAVALIGWLMRVLTAGPMQTGTLHSASRRAG